jgi:coenzyme F420-0:L-glutamate ligase / coenzyme F420-1:gamma-L-glutamate ligase
MNLAEAVAARRSVRLFRDQPVPRAEVERAIGLAVQAPAPHHSAPWRFVLVETPDGKERLASAMGAAWHEDLASDGMAPEKIESILNRSFSLLTATPLLVICCADMGRSHHYPDRRRQRAEWSLFAHSVGAALQTFMLALAESGISSCWISAPVFCGGTVQATLELHDHVEPHALVLVGYASPEYKPRPRPAPEPDKYIVYEG